MMEDDESLEMEPGGEAGAMDPTKIADLLRSLASQIAQLQQMFPADAGEEVATDLDDATEDAAAEQELNEEPVEGAPSALGTEEEDEEDDEDKVAAKSRAAALIARSMR